MPVTLMEQVKLLSEYTHMSCAAVIRDAIQRRVIEFQQHEKPVLDEIKHREEERMMPDRFYTPW